MGWRETLMTSHYLNFSRIKVQQPSYMHQKYWKMMLANIAGFKISTFSELQIPPKANVYYAINTQHDLNFVLKRKTSTEGAADLLKGSSNSTPGRKRDTSKARRKLLGLAL